MSAPFYKLGLFGDEVSLVFAFVIGVAFGFALERAGFGSARKLAAQFYFTDMAVFKVMFTAIITAMLGLFYLSWFGFVDITLVYLAPTYLVPQIVGGLILGVGFVVGGYCPGTSVVAVSTGRIDGAVFLLGITSGIFVFGEAYPSLAEFLTSSDLGELTLSQAFSIPYGVLVLAVVLMALGGFFGAEAVEKLMARKTREAKA